MGIRQMPVADFVFDPLLPWPSWSALALLLVALLLFGAFREGWRTGWTARGLRLAAGLVLLAALAQPMRRIAVERILPDELLIALDVSGSMALGVRQAQREAALSRLREEARDAGLVPHVVRVGRDRSHYAEDLRAALSAIDPARLSAVVLVGDGLVGDAPALDFLARIGVPVHLLLAGDPAMRDRRLVIERASEYAVVGKPVEIVVRVEENGTSAGTAKTVDLVIEPVGDAIRHLSIPIGRPVPVRFTPSHRGDTWIRLAVPPIAGEPVRENNERVVKIRAVRDRLRVLLISGEPHPGERIWRDILKSDPAIDLVHFTILRLLDSQDPARPDELSLIPFPTRRLFEEDLDGFDLVIFDRYHFRGVLARQHLENIRDYVTGGGSLLIANGPEFTGEESLARTPIGDLLPVVATGKARLVGFRPRLSKIGKRHPVTMPLAATTGRQSWGRWFRILPARVRAGAPVLSGPGGLPLLVLAHHEKGRLAMLMSDQFWLWARGIEGGGPYVTLLRRTLHWLMREPELAEEALRAEPEGRDGLRVTRRSLTPGTRPLVLEGPDGRRITRQMAVARTGFGSVRLSGLAPGVYRLASGDTRQVALVGGGPDPERDEVVASPERLAGLVERSGGGIVRLVGSEPQWRRTAADEPAHGDGWLGLPHRDRRQLLESRLAPLFAPAMAGGTAILLLLLAWWVERGRRPAGTAQSSSPSGASVNSSGSGTASGDRGR
ncbi:MAG: hypothetical protein D6757_06570 [Alphaproteobacteria bacterium]|nr:MAG: hypothetical protein D6757_06570 [Alphaproteobacteria bacterium]